MAEVTAEFEAVLERVGEARRFCQRTLEEWGLGSCEAPVSVVVTELATNAVLHAHSSFSVTLSYEGQVLRVGVTDHSPRVPVTKSHSVNAMSGRGLHLVAAYADAWGVEQHEDGKTVWASVRAIATQDIHRERSSGQAGVEPLGIVDQTTATATTTERGEPHDCCARWAA